MLVLRLYRNLVRFGKKQACWLVLVLFVLTLLPIPIPSAATNPESVDGPYPCQGGTCGCKSAQQCWSNCCCNTPAQRLAWARKHDIKPPTSLLVAIEYDESRVEKTNLHGQVLSPKPVKACCSTNRDNAKSSRENIDISKKTDSKKIGSKNGRMRVQIVIMIDALKCQGKSSSVNILTSTILTIPFQLITYRSDLEEALSIGNQVAESIFISFDPPPPRV